MYTDNQILLGKKLLRLQKKGFCVNAAEKELIKLFIINRKRLKEESIRNGLIMTYPQFYPQTYPQGD